MACTQCIETRPVAECVDLIALGVSARESLPVLVFVKNLSTGYVHKQEVMTDVDGLVVLATEFPDKSFYNQNHLYEVWVTAPDDNTYDNLPLMIDGYGDPVRCLLMSFFKSNPSDVTDWTITIAE